MCKFGYVPVLDTSSGKKKYTCSLPGQEPHPSHKEPDHPWNNDDDQVLDEVLALDADAIRDSERAVQWNIAIACIWAALLVLVVPGGMVLVWRSRRNSNIVQEPLLA